MGNIIRFWHKRTLKIISLSLIPQNHNDMLIISTEPTSNLLKINSTFKHALLTQNKQFSKGSKFKNKYLIFSDGVRCKWYTELRCVQFSNSVDSGSGAKQTHILIYGMLWMPIITRFQSLTKYNYFQNLME
jgi:hypothetical protein